jgi:hypothetical protein
MVLQLLKNKLRRLVDCMLPTSRFMYHINHKERHKYLDLYMIWLTDKDQQADCKKNEQKIFEA